MGFFRIQIYGFMSGSEQINYFFDLAYTVGKTTTWTTPKYNVTDAKKLQLKTRVGNWLFRSSLFLSFALVALYLKCNGSESLLLLLSKE